MAQKKSQKTEPERRPATSIEDVTQKRILDIIVQQDDVSWKQLIFGLIDAEQMDPWDINISLISQKFLEHLKKYKEMDFRISGKVVLASAILLKMKAERFADEDMAALDNLINASDEPVDLFDPGMDLLQDGVTFTKESLPQLIPRTPQPRKRKVSVYDLVEALEQALDTEAKRPPRIVPRVIDTIDPPENHIDISQIIKEVYDQIHVHYQKKKSPAGSLRFTHVMKSEDPRDIVMAFIPLLHLENARKVQMEQEEHFGQITIHLLDTTPPTKAEIVEPAQK